MKHLIHVGLILVMSVQTVQEVYANDRLDSILSVWNDQSQTDTVRLQAIYHYTWDGLLYSNTDSALHFARLGLELAEEIQNQNEVGYFHFLIGCVFFARGEASKANEYYEKAINAFREVGNDRGQLTTMSNMGAIYIDLGNLQLALSTLKNSLDLAMKTSDKPIMAGIIGNISNVYSKQGKFKESITALHQCLQIQEEIQDSVGLGNTLSNIGSIYHIMIDYELAMKYHQRGKEIRKSIGDHSGYAISLFNIGSVFLDNGEFVKSIECFNESIQIQEKYGDRAGMARTYNQIGKTQIQIQNYAEAKRAYESALKINREIDNKLGIGSSLQGIGEFHFKQGDRRMGFQFLTEALEIFQEGGFVEETKLVSFELYHYYKQFNLSEKALQMHELYVHSRDSISSKENIKELARFEFKYEYEKKALADSLRTLAENEALTFNHQLQVAQKETERNLYASGGLVLLLVTIFFFQRRANRSKILLKEKEAIYQREVLYATINSQESERRRIARDLHDEVGAMLSTIKLNLGTVEMQLKQAGLSEQLTSPARNLVDETINNVRGISKNLLPPTLEEFGLAHALNDLAEKVEEASGIPIKKDIQPLSQRLPIEHELALFRVIQEMINNAIKHAEATEFNLNMREQNGQLELSFSDNGKGFDLEAVKKSKSGKTGLGLKNLENRVGVAAGEMEFITAPGKGTELIVRVPLVSEEERAA